MLNPFHLQHLTLIFDFVDFLPILTPKGTIFFPSSHPRDPFSHLELLRVRKAQHASPHHLRHGTFGLQKLHHCFDGQEAQFEDAIDSTILSPAQCATERRPIGTRNGLRLFFNRKRTRFTKGKKVRKALAERCGGSGVGALAVSRVF